MLTITVEHGPICDINTQNKNKTIFIDQKILLMLYSSESDLFVIYHVRNIENNFKRRKRS